MSYKKVKKPVWCCCYAGDGGGRVAVLLYFTLCTYLLKVVGSVIMMMMMVGGGGGSERTREWAKHFLVTHFFFSNVVQSTLLLALALALLFNHSVLLGWIAYLLFYCLCGYMLSAGFGLCLDFFLLLLPFHHISNQPAYYVTRVVLLLHTTNFVSAWLWEQH